MFNFRKKELSSVEYEKLHTEILSLQRKIVDVEGQNQKIAEQLKSFQGRFYKRLGEMEDEDEKAFKGLRPFGL